MSIESKIEDLVTARNTIRSKMRAASQASTTDKLATLAMNLSIGVDTSDATATASNIDSGKTAYVNGSKITGTSTKIDTSDATATADKIMKGYTGYVNGVKITGTFVVPPTIKSFAEATDEEITAMLDALRAGTITYDQLITAGWTVGAERQVSLSAMAATEVGESHVAQTQTLVILHGKDMFDLSTSEGGGKNNFVVGLKNFLANRTSGEYGYINSSNTNVGGWNSSARRPWCDNVFKAALPAEVQKWFKKFKYKVSAGNKSTIIETLENYFTLPSEIEVFGSTTYSVSGEGAQMDYYKTTDNRKKYPGDSSSSADYWWERSPRASSTAYFCNVDYYGNAGNAGANYAYGLAPFGCV